MSRACGIEWQTAIPQSDGFFVSALHHITHVRSRTLCPRRARWICSSFQIVNTERAAKKQQLGSKGNVVAPCRLIIFSDFALANQAPLSHAVSTRICLNDQIGLGTRPCRPKNLCDSAPSICWGR